MSERKKEKFLSVFENFYVEKTWPVSNTLEETDQFVETCRKKLVSLSRKKEKITKKNLVFEISMSEEKADFCRYVG